MTALIGVIADTHGLVRASALEALGDSTHLVHAGDMGTPDILEALGRIGPVTAVRGNGDAGTWAESLPRWSILDLGVARILVVHNLAELEIDLAAEKVDAVISGHFHNPSIEMRENILYLNPGSAGPRRNGFPVTVARLRCHGNGIDPEIVHLGP